MHNWSGGLPPRLLLAADRGYHQLARRLLRMGAQPNGVCESGHTPLGRAANGGHIAIVGAIRVIFSHSYIVAVYWVQDGFFNLFSGLEKKHSVAYFLIAPEVWN